jgi:hypothetical protein
MRRQAPDCGAARAGTAKRRVLYRARNREEPVTLGLLFAIVTGQLHCASFFVLLLCTVNRPDLSVGACYVAQYNI